MFENKKHVFWQAFFLTALFFSLGIVFGIYIEQSRSDDTNALFYQSETSLYDSLALGILSNNPNVSCQEIKSANIDFANKIFEEALSLEDFDQSNKITKSLKSIHRKYDLLRTLLWINMISVKEKCKSINTVVYLYEYNTNDITTRSRQNVWSKILQDLKEQKGDEFILIPIAIDQNIISLEHLIKPYNITEFPVVIINEKDVIYENQPAENLGKLLN